MGPPSRVKTDLGSDAAPMEVSEGASTVVRLAKKPRAGLPVGRLIHQRETRPW